MSCVVPTLAAVTGEEGCRPTANYSERLQNITRSACASAWAIHMCSRDHDTGSPLCTPHCSGEELLDVGHDLRRGDRWLVSLYRDPIGITEKLPELIKHLHYSGAAELIRISACDPCTTLRAAPCRSSTGSHQEGLPRPSSSGT
jgi:hypothetical protein